MLTVITSSLISDARNVSATGSGSSRQRPGLKRILSYFEGHRTLLFAPI